MVKKTRYVFRIVHLVFQISEKKLGLSFSQTHARDWHRLLVAVPPWASRRRCHAPAHPARSHHVRRFQRRRQTPASTTHPDTWSHNGGERHTSKVDLYNSTSLCLEHESARTGARNERNEKQEVQCVADLGNPILNQSTTERNTKRFHCCYYRSRLHTQHGERGTARTAWIQLSRRFLETLVAGPRAAAARSRGEGRRKTIRIYSYTNGYMIT
jgi:hypothetical protein